MELKKMKIPGWPIQGKNVVPCVGSFFWYFWGDRPFDIREVRQAAGMRKNVYAADMDLKNPCHALEKNMKQLESIASQKDFEALLDEAETLDI